MKALRVLSLFDGISNGLVALKRIGIPVEVYYASEIKKSAIKISKHNHPEIVHVGDVTELSGDKLKELGRIDLLIGGSPCQDFSIARAINGGDLGKRKGLEGEKSSLFYEYLRILKECSPTYFLLENVKMDKSSETQLNEYLGVNGIHINSKLVSFQQRARIYWSNIPDVTIPEDLKINFQDYKETEFKKQLPYKVKRTPSREKMWGDGVNGKCPNVTYKDKVNCLTRKQDRWNNAGLVEFDGFCRYLTRSELEQAQTLPIGYTDINGISYTQACDVLGDGWTVDVIAHLFKGLRGVKWKEN